MKPFTSLEDAIRHHLNAFDSARRYDPVVAGVDPDLAIRLGPIEPVLARIDPLLSEPIDLNSDEVDNLVSFVRDALLDKRAKSQNLCKLVPATVPSGFSTMRFEGCPQRRMKSDVAESRTLISAPDQASLQAPRE